MGDRVSGGASDVRSVAEELRRQGKDAPARHVDQAADHAERLGGYLRDSDGDRILGDVEDLARRNTWAVVLGGLALGFAASRLLKASSADRYDRSRSGTGGLTTGGDPPSAVLPEPGTRRDEAAAPPAGTTGPARERLAPGGSQPGTQE